MATTDADDQPERTISVSLLDALDRAWAALAERLAGLTDDECAWQPVAGGWAVRRHGTTWRADWADPDPVPAPVTTISWRCWHLAVDCLDSYSGRLFGRSGTGLQGTEWVGSSAEATALLERAWRVFRAGVAGWSTADLLRPLGPAWGAFASQTHADLALHAAREVIHHGAEVALLRDLYAHRPLAR